MKTKTTFLIALFSFSAVAMADAPLPTFKAELGQHLNAMGNSMHKMLTPDTSYAVSGLRSIMTTSTYGLCTDAKRDHTRNERKKRDQINACLSVGEMTKTLAAKMNEQEAVRNERIALRANEQRLVGYVNTLTLAPRKVLGSTVHSEAVTNYNRHNNTLTQMANDETANTKSACMNLPLSVSVNCAMNRTIGLLQNTLPTAAVSHRHEMDRAINLQMARIEKYEDAAILQGNHALTAVSDEADEDSTPFSAAIVVDGLFSAEN